MTTNNLPEFDVTLKMARSTGSLPDEVEHRTFTVRGPARNDKAAEAIAFGLGHGINEATGSAWKFCGGSEGITVRPAAAELLAELDKVRAQLADTQKRAHTDATNLQQILRDKTALANENARLREQVCLIVTCCDCGEALEWDGATPHFRNLDEAKDILDDEGWRLIDGNPMCGDCCHYEPHAFKPERPGGLTCERCDLEEDDHEAATEKAEVAR